MARAGGRKSTFERLFELFLAHAGAAFDVSILSLGVKLSSGGFDLPVIHAVAGRGHGCLATGYTGKLPPVKVVVPGALPTTQRHAGQPKDEKNRGQNPKKMQSEPKPSKKQH